MFRKKEEENVQRLYSAADLKKLVIPLMIEQVMLSLMGTVDTIMVSNVGEAAVSGVSLVDSINKLVIYLFASIATGGTILCSQYLGCKDKERADESARQVLMCAFFLATAVMCIFLVFREGLLGVIFGSVEESVMDASKIYFLITLFSYPFISVFNAGSALFRASGNSRLPMMVSALSNVMNIIGNAILLFVVKMGAAGAALSTTCSVAASAIAIVAFLRRPGQVIDIGPVTKMRPDIRKILWVLRVGVPTGVENSMFQLGKLVVQSTVALLGTVAIASNAILIALELISSTAPMGMYIALITVAGTCIGAGRVDEAKYFIKKFTAWAVIVQLVLTWAIFAATLPVCHLAGLSEEATEMTFNIMLMISIIKPAVWPFAFVPPNGMRAAGDGTFSMVTASLSMWIVRVGLVTVLCRYFGFGLTGIWLGYIGDWCVRAVINIIRFRSGKWTKHKVMES